MNKFLKKNLPLIFFIFVPIVFLWHPNWLGFLGTQPYWPLFWLLPWSMINGSMNGLIFGLFLGLIFDSLTLESNFTQIPGLMICGFLFGKIKLQSDIFVGHFGFGWREKGLWMIELKAFSKLEKFQLKYFAIGLFDTQVFHQQ